MGNEFMNILKNKLLIISTILLFVTVSFYGIIRSVNNAKRMFASFHADITIKETVVLDNQDVLKVYGGPVTLEKGMTGKILDYFSLNREIRGYEHIHAQFAIKKGTIIEVILEFEPEENEAAEKTYGNETEECFIQENTIASSPNRIRIDKIENYQELISEFKQIRDDYYQKVKQTIVSGSVFAVIIAIVLVAIVWTIRFFVRKNNVGKILTIATICVDVVMALAALIELYFTNQY